MRKILPFSLLLAFICKRLHFPHRRHCYMIQERRLCSRLRTGCRRRPMLMFAVIILIPIITALGYLIRGLIQYHGMLSQRQDILTQLQRLNASCLTQQMEVDHLTSLLAALPNNSIHRRAAESFRLSSEELLILRNLTDVEGKQGTGSLPSLRLPSVHDLVPHLRRSPKIQPAHYMSQGRSGVSFVVGVSTVKREAESYLVDTLRTLFESMKPKEAENVLVVVLIAETDSEYVLRVCEELEENFLEEIETGLLDVISPPASYYPVMQSLRLTLGDNYTRVLWRSKQSLDYAFLMMYAQEKGVFYIQVEDDIRAERNFIKLVRRMFFVLEAATFKRRWFILSFSRFGFIGKMIHCSNLPLLIEYLLLFYNDQPPDWAMQALIEAVTCGDSSFGTPCSNEHHYIRSVHLYPLFFHRGLYSSLEGKVQDIYTEF